MGDFPAPPVFYQKYTAEAFKNGTTPPPPKPPGAHFLLYGQPMNLEGMILSSLQGSGLPVMADIEKSTHADEIKRLNREGLRTFLAILEHASAGAIEKRNEALDQLRTIFFNIHHLINEFRPHQALETVKVMLEEQVKQRESLAAEIQRHIDHADGVLDSTALHQHTTVKTAQPSIAPAIAPAEPHPESAQ